MNRLWVQLTLALTLVVLVAVGAIALLIIRTTDTEFRQYITRSDMQASGSGIRQLVAYYEEHGGWHGVESLLDQAVVVTGPLGTAWPIRSTLPGRPTERLNITLADARGKVVYDTEGESVGKRLVRAQRSQALPIEQDDGQVIGYILLSLPGGADRLGALEQRFLDRMQRLLILGATVAVAVGLVVGVLLSRSLTAPLQRLAAAARAVAAGNLGQQVRVEGSAEMVEVGQAFNDMTAALARSEQQRQNMVADVAHELRNPLTVVQGNLRAILDGVYPLEAGEISRVYDETRLLGRLVDDLRELALADAGQLRLHLRPIDVVPVVQAAIDNLALAAAAQEVVLEADLPGGLPVVRADTDRVAQVLRNLLVNAVRHTAAGGSVTVTAAQRGDVVEIAVTDTGEGIAAADLPHVFDRFWRADPARARHGSAGLGLSVAQSLVEAQGGRIWVESAVGLGSVFRFTLPAA